MHFTLWPKAAAFAIGLNLLPHPSLSHHAWVEKWLLAAKRMTPHILTLYRGWQRFFLFPSVPANKSMEVTQSARRLLELQGSWGWGWCVCVGVCVEG